MTKKEKELLCREIEKLIKALDKYKVLDLDTEKSSLEDIFMHYYGDLNISQKSD